MTQDETVYYTTKEACEKIGVSYQTLKRYCKIKKIKSYRLPGRIGKFYRQMDIEIIKNSTF